MLWATSPLPCGDVTCQPVAVRVNLAATPAVGAALFGRCAWAEVDHDPDTTGKFARRVLRPVGWLRVAGRTLGFAQPPPAMGLEDR
jgi:hypothetical protein